MDIALGPWTPDQPAFANRGVVDAKNVYRTATGYRPFNRPSMVSEPLPEPTITGMFYGKDADSNLSVFVATNTRIWRYTATKNWADVSKAGGYVEGYDTSSVRLTLSGMRRNDVTDGIERGEPDDVAPSTTRDRDRWASVQFEDRLILANLNNPMQVWNLNGQPDSKFADLSPSAPRASKLAVVRDFVFAGDTWDIDDGFVPFRVRWSGLRRPTEWDYSATTQADFNDFPDAGNVMGIVGGNYATILCEKGIYIGTFVGPPVIFQFDKIKQARGCFASGSIIAQDSVIYYLADDGFHAISGAETRNISAERVTQWFWNELNVKFVDYISAATGPENDVIYWLFCGKGSTEGIPNRVLIYNVPLGEWSYAEIEMEALGEFAQPSYNLDELDSISPNIEDLPAPLDSRYYKQGARLFGGLRNGKLAAFSGTPLDAVIETKDVQIAPPGRAAITTINAITEAPVKVAVQVGTRTRQGDPVKWGKQISVLTEGLYTARAEGRYHRLRLYLSGDWRSAQTIQVLGEATSLR